MKYREIIQTQLTVNARSSSTMNTFATWILLLPFVSCEIVINHGDKLNFTTTMEFIDDKIRFRTEQEIKDGIYTRINEETEVEVRYDIPSKQSEDDTIAVYKYNFGKNGKDYSFYYSTSNINTRDEDGILSKNPEGIESLKVQGSYSYDSPEGFVYIQGYTADENGFRTKVSFGKDVVISETKTLSVTQTPLLPAKQIDPVLLCSLIGSGCER